MINNKKARADIEDPQFWGIAGVFWLFCNVFIWRPIMFESPFSLQQKIIITVISAPIIWGICYMMGQGGD